MSRLGSLRKLSILAASAIAFASVASTAHAAVAWRTNVDQAAREAAQLGRPLLVDVYADWCGPCKMLEANVFSRADVATAINSKFVPLKVDADASRAFGQRYDVTGLPTSLILSPEGEEIDRLTGYVDASRYGQFLQGGLAKADTMMPGHGEQVDSDDTGIAWQRSLRRTLSTADRERKLVLVDVYAEWCGPCKMLDQTTFQDPGVIAAVGESFLPVKVDADRNRSTVSEYEVEAYPTTLVLHPDGSVLARQVGYLDAAAYQSFLSKAVRSAGDLAGGQGSPRMQQEIAKAKDHLAAGEYALAYSGFQEVARYERSSSLGEEARNQIAELDARAAEMLERARAAGNGGNWDEATRLLCAVRNELPASSAAKTAGYALRELHDYEPAREAVRVSVARVMLERAEWELEHAQEALALDRLARVANEFSDLPEGKAATDRMEELRNDPAFVRSLADAEAGPAAKRLMTRGRSWALAGDEEKARKSFEQVIAQFPQSSFAEEASDELRKL